MISLLAGIATSTLHVISGPDHLAAVTPLALRSRLKSWFVGLFWGIGHVLGALTIGGLFLMLRELIPIDLISKHSEQLVGLILILIGLWAIWKITRKHEHHHHHLYEISESKTILSALAIGIIHGLAGVSHIVGILPTLALPTRLDAILYLGGFAFGTIFTMVVYSAILGLIAQKTATKQLIYKRINAVGGIFAIVVGVYWIGSTWI